MRKKPTYISLFSSAGVGCYGFKLENFDCIATNELIEARLNIQKINKKCKYESGYLLGDITNNFIKNSLYKEIKFWEENEHLDTVDVVIATPPCQGMSTANYKKKDETKRNSLVVEAIEIIKNIKPKIFVFENVRSFMNTFCVDKLDKKITIKECIFNNLGDKYNIYFKTINFKDFGVPSSRPRTIVIGTNKSIINFSPLNIFPISKKPITLREAISDLPNLRWGEISSNDIYHSFRTYPKYMKKWIHSLKEGQSAFDKNNINKPYKLTKGAITELKGGYMGNKFRRMLWDEPAPCIATRNDQLGSQSTIHPSQDRVLSIREIMRVMSVPDSFLWSDKNVQNYKQTERIKFLSKNELTIRRALGEAVPTIIMKTIARNIKECLEYNDYIRNNVLNNKCNNFYIKSKIIENKIIDAKNSGEFYTPQSVVFDLLKNVQFKENQNVKILEPAVGMGAFLPQLFRVLNNCSNAIIDVYDINSKILRSLRNYIKLIPYDTSKIKIRYHNKDFLKSNCKIHYDLVIGNPPYKKITKIEKNEYLNFICDKNISNLFGLFLSKIADITNEICFVIPKTFLMTPEFNNLRNRYQNEFYIKSIDDYGVNYFDKVFVEIISIYFTKTKLESITITNKINNICTKVPQKYIYHDKYWLIYRNSWFDSYIKKLKLNIFDFYRDREITNKFLLNEGKIRVLKSKNILDNGQIKNIKNYDKYINNIDDFIIKKYINKNKIIITNFTYNLRATYLPDNSIVNGSLAILSLKNKDDFNKINLNLYSTEEFRKYYAIVKNNSKFTINIDANSIYYIGVLK